MQSSPARLEVVAGNAVGMSILVRDELMMGRHADGPGRLADDEEISRLHARVTLEPGGVCAIEDLGSTNGTFVNGLRISGIQTLSVGDTVELGQTTLVVRELPPAAGPAAPSGPPADAGQAAAPVMQPTIVPVPAARPAPPATPPGPPAAEPGPPPAPEPPAPPAPEPLAEPPAPEPLAEPPAPEPVAEPPAPEPVAPELTPVESDAAAPEPATAGEELAGAPQPPPLSLKLEVDFARHEARLFLSDDDGPVRLAFADGAWRIDPTLPDEKGGAE